MKSKKQTQKEHAKKRFAERLNLKYSQYINDMLLHMIHSNRAKVVKKQSNRVSVYEVTFTPRLQDSLNGVVSEVTVHIVYDKFRKTIVTVSEPGSAFDSEELQDET